MELEESGIGEECGLFGCVSAGEWPTQLEVAQVLTLGLVALQHRYEPTGVEARARPHTQGDFMWTCFCAWIKVLHSTNCLIKMCQINVFS